MNVTHELFVWLATYNLYTKAVHIIAVVCWFAGLFYLPRLFVYHAQSNDFISRNRFHIMEYKLYTYIMTPSMVLVLITGLMLLFSAGSWDFYLKQYWMHAKLLCVFLLILYHFICKRFITQLQENRNKQHIYYRVFNEIPSILLIIIVFLVVTKPF